MLCGVVKKTINWGSSGCDCRRQIPMLSTRSSRNSEQLKREKNSGGERGEGKLGVWSIGSGGETNHGKSVRKIDYISN